MKKNFNRVRNSLMTKALTILGFCSPLALLACYGAPTTDYPPEEYVEESELTAVRDIANHTDEPLSDGHDDDVYIPDSVVSE